MNSFELQSKVFDFLRFPLIIGVIFIHNYGLEGDWSELCEVVNPQTQMPLFYISNVLFSQVLGNIAVPLFFFMSGYLFFYNTDFNKEVYKRKLKSRCKTLLMPYLFWNAAPVLLFLTIAKLPFLSPFFNRTFDFNLAFLVDAFIGNSEGFPLAYQFWFIRDLMVVVVFTPLIYWFLQRTKSIGLAMIGLCWLLDFSLLIFTSSTSAWFFFMAGAYLSINKKNVLTVFSLFGNWVYALYALVAVADLCTKGMIFNPYLHNVGILLGIMACFRLSAYLIGERNVKVSPFLAASSFFIFAVHEQWLLTTIRRVINLTFNPSGDMVMTFLYFGYVILTVLIALALYYVLQKTMPRFTAFITGGRA